MARIDEFFKAMAKYQATEFHLVSDAEPQFKIARLMQPVSKQKFTRQEVLSLISEVLPQDKKELLMSSAAVDFVYQLAGVGDFRGQVTMDGSLTSAVFVPEADASLQAAEQASPAMTASKAAAAPSADQAPGVTGGGREPEINALLKLLVQRKGSDLHLSSGEHPIIRVDGDIKKLEEYPVTAPADAQRMLYEIMSKRHRKQFDEISDTDFAHEIPGLARFRVNIFADRKGMGGVFRVIPSRTVTVDELGVSQAIQNLCFLNKGLVLVTGPTGSGKSTTLCAMIDLINRTRTAHIITLEDPIEFVHENKKCLINQREVGSHTQSFKNALRAALREDPNIVLVGEMRDLETISIAIETSETGHLVFATLHTSTAPSTVDRIIEQFPPDRQEQIRIMLSESLKGVISQTLCKKAGGGRVAAMEVLLGLPSVSNLIRESKTYQLPSVIQTNKKIGMISLNDALMDFVNKKQVEAKEAYMKSVDKTDMLAQLRRDGHSTAFVDEIK